MENKPPKPIILIGFDFENFSYDDRCDFLDAYTKTFYDYHLLCYHSNNFEFKVFYEKDFEQVKFDELKKIVQEKLAEKCAKK